MLSILFSCKKESKKEISFYYWRTTFSLSLSEKKALEDLNVKKIYLRYFDIENVENKIRPVKPIQFDEKPNKIQIIPVIFIRNQVLLNPEYNANTLSENILHLIQSINEAKSIPYDEIQLDCDWSLKTKSKYFSLITAIKEKSKLKVSATVRLHQIKYSEKTGIPDVDYGVLMYYNMGKISADNSNSIYERKQAQKYSFNLAVYPKKLKIALPIFSWYVHTREKMVLQVYTVFEKSDFADKNKYKVNGNWVTVLKSGIVKGIYLQENDKLKLESESIEDVKQMISDIENRGLDFNEVILFDLNLKNLKNINYEKIN